jgi:2-oxoacid dehydrogenases acyltransferase (catalytic domain)
MTKARPVTGWRKLAGASWRAPSDPQFFGSMDIDAAALVAYAQSVRERADMHVTMTHLIGRAVAHGLQTVPALRQRLSRGRVYDRESIDVFFIITTDGGRDLTGVKIEHADEKSAVEVAAELLGRRGAIQQGADPGFGRSKQMLEALPRPLLRAGLWVSAWLTSDLNLDLPRFGLPRQAFGSAMVTSVGMWGITNAYSPLTAYYRVPVLVLIGAVEPRPAARAGLVVVRPMITVTATFDHRYVDGYQAAQFASAIHAYCANPAAFEPPLPSPAAPSEAASSEAASGKAAPENPGSARPS